MQCAGGINCDGGGGLWSGGHDSTFHAKEEVQRGRPLDMADKKGGPEGDRSGGLHPLHEQTQLFQRGDQGGTDEHRSVDGPGGDSRGRIAEERRVPKEEDILANQTTDSTTIDGGRSIVCNTQRGGGKDAAANEGASVLDLPGNLASRIQTDGTTENREGHHYRVKTGETRVPTSTAGGQT